MRQIANWFCTTVLLQHFHAIADQYAEAKMDLRKVVDTGKQKEGKQ